MRFGLFTVASVLVAGLSCSAQAADLSALPFIGWNVSFGAPGQPMDPALSLGLNSLIEPTAGVAPSIVRVRISAAELAADVGGMPLLQRHFRMNAVDEASSETPWYSSQWVWWAAGGLAAAVAVGASHSSGSNDDGSSSASKSNNCALDDGNGTCYVPCPGPGPNSCVGNALLGVALRGWTARDEQQWLDAGSGYMGDLVEQTAAR